MPPPVLGPSSSYYHFSITISGALRFLFYSKQKVGLKREGQPAYQSMRNSQGNNQKQLPKGIQTAAGSMDPRTSGSNDTIRGLIVELNICISILPYMECTPTFMQVIHPP